MSNPYICDITGSTITKDEVNEHAVLFTNANYKGKKLDIHILIKVDERDAIAGTHIIPSEWPDIVALVKGLL